VTRTELYATIDDILEVPIGTITGTEQLSSLPTWDSLAVVSYIATCNGLFGVVLSGDSVKATRSIADLVALIAKHIDD
jgi:acyl carrier protein